MFEPMSLRSMCGHDRFSSSASAPSSWQAVASVCQCSSSRSLPEPAMIEATRMRSGCACLIRAMRGTHQSSGLSEMSSQFHDECSAVPGRFCIDRCGASGVARRNFVFGPRDVDDRMQADGLGDDAAPAGVEGAHDVAVRLGRRRRRQQERVLEAQAGERRRERVAHGRLQQSSYAIGRRRCGLYYNPAFGVTRCPMPDPTLVARGPLQTQTGADVPLLQNFIGGRWVPVDRDRLCSTSTTRRVGTVIATDAAVDRPRRRRGGHGGARRRFPAGARRRRSSRARTMFRFKALLEEHFDELARIVTTEHGKTLDEARGSVRRGIECVEVACGAPSLLMGYGLENIAAGIDCHVDAPADRRRARRSRRSTFRRWCRCGSCRSRSPAATRSSLKPSEQVPLSQQRMFELLEQCDLPPGVVNLVNGGREVVEAICDHPGHPRGVVRRLDAGRAARLPARHARRQARAGARRREELRHRDARRRSRSQRSPIITESFYGCAGERCLAGSVLRAGRRRARRGARPAGRGGARR